MRHDMLQVLIERPRLGQRVKTPKGSRKRLSQDLKGEFYKIKESMDHQWKLSWQEKQFSDLFGPIIKFLRSRTGRYWNDIFSEIKDQNVDNHFLRHIDELVTQNQLRIGERMSRKTYETHSWFYVDIDGILREHIAKSEKYIDKTKWIDKKNKLQLKKINGLWYIVKFEKLEFFKTGYSRFCFLIKKRIYLGEYCSYKRQLSAKELRLYKQQGLI